MTVAELAWKTHPITPPEEIDKLITELRAGRVDERHLEWDIHFLMSEAVALFHAEVVLFNSMSRLDIPPDVKQKREPFLQLADKIVESERNSRLDQIWELIGKLRGLNRPSASVQEALNSGDGTYKP